jgi:hypothetical protein
MHNPESPMSFYESLPPHTRDWCWLPRLTLTLTLDLPTGEGTLFHTRYAPRYGMMAHNVASLTYGGSHAHPAA